MSVAMYIVVEREIEGVETFVNGKAVAHVEQHDMDSVCASLGIRSPYDYVSQNPDELRETLEEFGEEVPDELPPELWFEPAEGVKLTETLAAHLRAKPEALDGVEEVLEDLDEYGAVFKQLQAHGVRWHFAIDF